MKVRRCHGKRGLCPVCIELDAILTLCRDFVEMSEALKWFDLSS